MKKLVVIIEKGIPLNLEEEFSDFLEKKDNFYMIIDTFSFQFLNSDNKIEIYTNSEKNEITFSDFQIIGTPIKDFLIEKNLISSHDNLKNIFKLEEYYVNTIDGKIEKKLSLDDLDKKLHKVPENDEKLLEVLNKVNKIKKVKLI